MDRKTSKDTLVESETAAEELMNELAAVDKIRSSWKHSPEEEALEKLTASTSKIFLHLLKTCFWKIQPMVIIVFSC